MTPFRRAFVVVSLLVGTFLAALDVMVVGTAMPTIIADLGGLPLYGWVFASYLLMSTTTVPIYGKLADRWGRKPTFLLGAALFLVGSVACGLAPSMLALIVARGVQGVGAGAIIPMTMTIFGDLFPVEQRVKLQGAFSVVWGVSSVLGPVVGGAIVERWPWPWVFYINLPIGVAACAGLGWALREDVPHRDARIDWAGAILLTAAITSMLLGLTLLEQRQFVLAPGLMVASLLLGVWFFVVERRAEDPIVPLALFKDRVIAVTTASGVFIGGVLFPTVAFLPLLMRGAYGDGAMRAGASITPLSLTWTLATFAASRLILRAGYRPTVLVGASCLVVGGGCVALAPWLDEKWLAVVGAAAVGAGMGLIVTSHNVVTQDRVDWGQRGAATAVLLFSRTVGGTVFVSVLGLVMASSLASRLADLPNPPNPDMLVDPEQWSRLDAEVLDRAREALRLAIGVVLVVVACSALAVLVGSFAFPRIKAREGASERRVSGGSEG